MNDQREPLFLERESYRQRRTIDAARLLPALGFLALCLPILWDNGSSEGDGARVTSVGVIYLFGVWIILIGAALVLARRLRRIDADQDAAD